MRPVFLIAFLGCLLLLAGSGAALAEEPLLRGSADSLASTGLATDSEVAAWLTFRYDAHKETGLSLPGQKDFQSWLVGGRCRWIEGLNLAAGYQIWAPTPIIQNEIYTTRGGVSYRLDGLNTYLQNKAAELSVERSSFADPTREPSYGAVAAFTMQF
jgi:hypothetical protein